MLLLITGASHCHALLKKILYSILRKHVTDITKSTTTVHCNIWEKSNLVQVQC